MGRPKVSCDYDLFGQCREKATVRFTVTKKREKVFSQYCDEHVTVMLDQPIPEGWKIKERVDIAIQGA